MIHGDVVALVRELIESTEISCEELRNVIRTLVDSVTIREYGELVIPEAVLAYALGQLLTPRVSS